MFCWCESGISEKIQGKLILIQVISLRLEKLDCTVHSFQICVNCCYIYVGGGGGGGGGGGSESPASHIFYSCFLPFPYWFPPLWPIFIAKYNKMLWIFLNFSQSLLGTSASHPLFSSCLPPPAPFFLDSCPPVPTHLYWKLGNVLKIVNGNLLM